MNCKFPHCRQSVKRYGYCQIHWNKAVRDMKKLIDKVRIKGTPYKATPDTCIEGFDSEYKNKETND